MTTTTMRPGDYEALLQARLAELRVAAKPRRTTSARAARPRRALTVVFMTGILMVFGAVMALAVHEVGILEVDGNLVDQVDTLGPPIVTGTDWAAFQDSDGDLIPANLPAGTIAATGVIEDFVIDEHGPDDSYHEPSNHDQQGIDPLASGTWGCVSSPNPTDKDDIVNAYAIAVQPGGVGTDVYFYFGVERFDNSGTAFIGVWLFQENVACDETLDKFTGEKKTGDILILTDFTNGGAITSLKAYRFTAGATPADPGTFALITPAGADCDATLAGDFLCANVNTLDVTTPWDFQDKDKPGPPNPDPDNIMEVAEFFEGGINLTDAFAAAQLPLPQCFGSFLAETRSSDVLLGATLKDYALGDFDTCGDITAHKYHDLNANGVDDSDPALSGWTIFIDENGNETLDGGEESAVTDGSGDVSFVGLPFGDYDICEVLKVDWFNSDPGGGTLCETVTVSAENDPYVDFGNYQNGTKSGTKVEDTDADGSIGEDSANGLLGWTINAYADDGDGVLSLVEFNAGAFASDATDGNGDYTITGLTPGDYVVCEVGQADWFQSYPVSGSGDCSISATLGAEGYAITITSGEDEVDNDFGNFQQATKAGFKFNDADNSGTWDLAEPGLAGWTIVVYADGGSTAGALDTGDTFVDSVTTADGLGADPLGYYEFTLDPGDYIVCEVLQATWQQTFPTGNTVCENDLVDATLAPAGYAITLTSGQLDDDNDFGNFQPPTEGCTPGFWKTHIEMWDGSTSPDLSPTYDPGDDFYAVFGITIADGGALPDILTLEDALNLNGGGIFALARHAAAALLNSDASLDYPYTTAQVIDIFRDGINASTLIPPDEWTLQEALAALSTANELGCPFGATSTTTSIRSTSGFGPDSFVLAGVLVSGLVLPPRRRRILA
jgi:hypothetical protein